MKIKSQIDEIPYPIRLFLGKALLFFVVWKILFLGFISSSKVLDYPLTTHVGQASVEVLNKFSSMSGFEAVREEKTTIFEGEYATEVASQIYHNDKKVL